MHGREHPHRKAHGADGSENGGDDDEVVVTTPAKSTGSALLRRIRFLLALHIGESKWISRASWD